MRGRQSWFTEIWLKHIWLPGSLLYFLARDVGRGEEAVAALKKEGLNPKFHQLDISNDDSVKTLAAFLKEKYGGVDVFVNNAAIAYKVWGLFTYHPISFAV